MAAESEAHPLAPHVSVSGPPALDHGRGIPLLPWSLLGLFTIPLAIAAIATWYLTRGAILFGDVDWYASALPRLLADVPLYDPAKLTQHVAERPPFWNQAPATALFSLVMLLPAGGHAWGLLMIAGVLTGLALTWPRVGPGGAVLLAPVLVVWPPVLEALAWANINGLVFGLLAIAWRFPKAAGVAVGIAAAAKLIPILAVAWLAGRKDWRGVITASAILVAATVAVVVWKGPSTVTDFITLRSHEAPSPGLGAGVGLTALTGISQSISYLAAAFLVVLAFRYGSLSLAIVAMLFSVAELHLHYLTWLLIPILGVWIPWVVRRRPAFPLGPRFDGLA
jgi:alpha-1,2-mannosyltransferase